MAISLIDIENKLKNLDTDNVKETNNKPQNNEPKEYGIEKKQEENKPVEVSYKDMIDTYMPSHISEQLNELKNKDKAKFIHEMVSYSNKSKFRIGKKCNGEECINYFECPLYKTDPSLVPEGSRCPFELMDIDKIYTKYYNILNNDVKVEKYLIDIYLKELIILEVNINRINEELASEGIYHSTPGVVIQKSAEVIYSKEINPMYDLLDKLNKRRDTILKILLITPEAKARYNISKQKDLEILLNEMVKRSSEAIDRFQKIGYNTENTKQIDVKEIIAKEKQQETE